MVAQQTSSARIFGGQQNRYQHTSTTLSCEMTFSVFLPPQAELGYVPVIYYLSGLTCTDENFVTKAGAQRYAAERGLALVAPDTSPRGEKVPDDPTGSYDMGLGAGFYVNATQDPWRHHYQMYDYITQELPKVIGQSCLPIDISRASIMGHSMGGHGALIIGLKNPDKFKSISAFSPIVAPTQCPWGKKAFNNYLGSDESTWSDYDACELIKGIGANIPIRIDQGEADDFLESQLKTSLIIEAASIGESPIEVFMQEGYDHSYYFIASFIEEHIIFHAKQLLTP